MKGALLLSLATALLPHTQAQFVNCTEDVLIRNQDDADELKQCDSFGGRVVLGPDATGDIRITGQSKFRHITNFDCPDKQNGCVRYKTSVTSIYSDVQNLYGVDLIGGFDQLTKISLPNLTDAYEFELEDMPKLETVEADSLLTKKGVLFLTLAGLPQLKSITPDGNLIYSGRFNVTNTGLDKFNAMPRAENLTMTPGISIRDSKPIAEVVSLILSREGSYADNLIRIVGGGDASVELSVVGKDGIDFRDFTITGAKEMTLDTSVKSDANITASSLNITGNAFKTLPIPLNNDYRPALTIAENPELETIHFGSTTMMKGLGNNIVIANNPKLYLKSAYNHNDNDTTFVWPVDTSTDMTLVGNFDQAFL
jgi:hypothetical protein